MKRAFALLLIFAILLSLCACSGINENANSSPKQILHAHISDDLPLYEIRVNKPGTTDELTNEAVYSIEVLEPNGEVMATEQILTVRSTVKDDNNILELYDINFDGYSDMIVRYNQTPHSAAWYCAYRWLTNEQHFEAEPFFEFCCSGEPIAISESRMLVTMDVTLSSVYETLYKLDADGNFNELRRCCIDRYDCYHYIIEELQEDKWGMLCDERFSFDEEITVQDSIRLTSIFLYGNNWSVLNDLMRFAELYAYNRETSRSYESEQMTEMLTDDDEELLESEKQYSESLSMDTEAVSAYATSISYTDDSCRVNVTVRTNTSESGGKSCFAVKYLAIDVKPDFLLRPLCICGVSDGVPPTQDDNAVFDIEYSEAGETIISFYDMGHNRLEHGFWPMNKGPEMTFIDDSLLEFRYGAGTGVWVSVYYDLATRSVSNCFTSAFYLGKRKIMFFDLTEDNRMCIHIENAFDKNEYGCKLYSDFAPVGNPYDALMAYELLDGSHLSMTYVDSEWRIVTQVFEIPDIYENS